MKTSLALRHAGSQFRRRLALHEGIYHETSAATLSDLIGMAIHQRALQRQYEAMRVGN
jgi:hypothetical protein